MESSKVRSEGDPSTFLAVPVPAVIRPTDEDDLPNVATGEIQPFPPGEKPAVETIGSASTTADDGLIGDVHTVADDLSDVSPKPDGK